MNIDFDIELNFAIFKPVLEKRPEINTDTLKKDLQNYYLPFIQKLINLKQQKNTLYYEDIPKKQGFVDCSCCCASYCIVVLCCI